MKVADLPDGSLPSMADLQNLSAWWPCSYFDHCPSSQPSDHPLIEYKVRALYTIPKLPCSFLASNYVSCWQTLEDWIPLSNARLTFSNTLLHSIVFSWYGARIVTTLDLVSWIELQQWRKMPEWTNIARFCGRCSTWPSLSTPSDIKIYI
jgi:hypothetical protein